MKGFFSVSNSPTLTLHNFSFRNDTLNAPKGQEIIRAVDGDDQTLPKKCHADSNEYYNSMATPSPLLQRESREWKPSSQFFKPLIAGKYRKITKIQIIKVT